MHFPIDLGDRSVFITKERRRTTTESEIRPRIHDTDTNTATLTIKYKGEFTARVKLQHYPFDVHMFVLHLKPRKHGKASDPDHLRVVASVFFEALVILPVLSRWLVRVFLRGLTP